MTLSFVSVSGLSPFRTLPLHCIGEELFTGSKATELYMLWASFESYFALQLYAAAIEDDVQIVCSSYLGSGINSQYCYSILEEVNIRDVLSAGQSSVSNPYPGAIHIFRRDPSSQMPDTVPYRKALVGGRYAIGFDTVHPPHIG